MIPNISVPLDSSQHCRPTYAGGTILVIITAWTACNGRVQWLIHRQWTCFLPRVRETFWFPISFARTWDLWTRFTSDLSVAINDPQVIAAVNRLIFQTNDLNRYATLWNGKIDMLSWMIDHYCHAGTVRANRTTNNFNQSIPNSVLQSLFSNPVNLTNLHQPWFMNRTNSFSTFAVALEIGMNSIQPNLNYVRRVERPPAIRCQCHMHFSFSPTDQTTKSSRISVPMDRSIRPFPLIRLNGPRRTIFSVKIYLRTIWSNS